MFHKVHTASAFNFNRKNYARCYQINCQYPGQKVASLTNGTVKFIDNKHIKVPK